jgi:hypothetical protein
MYPDGKTLRSADESEQLGMMNRDIEITRRRQPATQRPPGDALVLDRLAAVRVDGDLMAAPRELARATNDARFGAAERACVDVLVVRSVYTRGGVNRLRVPARFGLDGRR